MPGSSEGTIDIDLPQKTNEQEQCQRPITPKEPDQTDQG
jgi:hypothetical protein